jgi:hypothetical protein
MRRFMEAGRKQRRGMATARGGALALVAALAVGAAALAQAKDTVLMYGGKVASRKVRVINGESYVPVRDIAGALGLTVVPRPGVGIELTREGGANQVEGLRGKVGDTLFTGFWRFQVTGIKVYKNYERINSYYGETEIGPNGENDVLLAVECIARNGQKESAALRVLSDKTQVAGTDGTSMVLKDCDMRIDGARTYSAGVLPGAAHKVVLVFSVPKDFEPKDLVVTIGAGLDEKTERTLRIAVDPTNITAGAGAN